MINRTIVNGVSAQHIDAIRTPAGAVLHPTATHLVRQVSNLPA
jgi:hypothetical protein